MGILARCNALYIPVAMFACKAKNVILRGRLEQIHWIRVIGVGEVQCNYYKELSKLLFVWRQGDHAFDVQ